MALDDTLAEVLASGAIKLIRADFMKQSTQPHLLRRQDLEALERDKQIAVFLKPDEAVALLRSNTRAIAALTYGWVTPDHPDETDEYLAATAPLPKPPARRAYSEAVFGISALPQKPRSDEDQKTFDGAIKVMNSVYASAMGTMVVRHKTIPRHRPARLDGELVVLVDGNDVDGRAGGGADGAARQARSGREMRAPRAGAAARAPRVARGGGGGGGGGRGGRGGRLSDGLLECES